jgi:hypothetical protein
MIKRINKKKENIRKIIKENMHLIKIKILK